jgi:hypothetical protein
MSWKCHANGSSRGQVIPRALPPLREGYRI